MERIKDLKAAINGPYPDEQLLVASVGELRKLAQADPYMAMQHEAASAFNNVTQPVPRLPNWTPFEAARLERYAHSLASLARQMKADAAQLRADGYDNLATWLIRGQLLTEETGEVLEAVAQGDLAHALNELVDVSYVADGTFLTMGTDRLKMAAYAEVHAANMSKCVPCDTCAETGPHDPVSGTSCPTCSGLGRRGQVDASGRHLKGPGYRKPDLARVLKDSA